MNDAPKYTNALIHETSPYLLQHAHNPVNWHAWHQNVLEQAAKENKLLLISIGYAACHWCHVMEHECFENEEVAAVMNQHFINIKIDREERPDIDHIYMDALQMMTGSGGWPLNIVALPDGRPFWGATYVRKNDWMNVLQQLATLFKDDKKKVLDYAQNLANGIRSINVVPPAEHPVAITTDQLAAAVKQWSQHFDTFLGGYKRAPKFMMPANLDFLLHYATLIKDTATLSYVDTTLTRMAYGGIFDQVGGGFSRYAVDTKWHVPHFEKMLYDNAQLVSLYAKAYAATKNTLYREIVVHTISFVASELMAPNFGFYSSLDADSIDAEGQLEEGAFYVWTTTELEPLLKEDFPIFKDYYNINSYGHWEEDKYVLIRDAPAEEIATKHDLSVASLKEKVARWHILLKDKRSERPRPRLDDKILTSWNALMIKGLTDAYRYLGDPRYLEMAINSIRFLEMNLQNTDGGLFHNHKEGKSTINGFLEDYATLIDAFLGLHEVTLDESWLEKAKTQTNYVLQHFLDPESGLFFFTSDTQEVLVRRTLETADNVIPASNSIMAHALFKLSLLFPGAGYDTHLLKMLGSMQEPVLENPNSHAHWLHLPLNLNFPFREIAISGREAKEKAAILMQAYLPNSILAGAETESSLALFENRWDPKRTLIYVCERGSCQLPVDNPEDVFSLIK